ncbi:MAG: hypothetical protein CVU40_04340 [Chloroflexi bacterium HGW-Chloroflexi-2]|jgi:hypothetical protein|nr:MAG: hypothetical protein CVU40_04340 [Chloroflexi bacterium HGW-Chloroflexi-2]
MDWILLILVVVWLGIVSWFDIRKSEIPHSVWVIIPLFGACFYRTWQGNWALVLLTVLVAAVSERERISHLIGWEEIGKMIIWFPLLFLGVYFSVQTSPFAPLAIIGFWVAWELKWWGGADAVATMTIIMIYPEIKFIFAFLTVHVIVTIWLTIKSLVKENTVRLHRIPGLPLLLIAVILFQMIKLLS